MLITSNVLEKLFVLLVLTWKCADEKGALVSCSLV